MIAAAVLLGLVAFGNYAMRDVRARPDTPAATSQPPTATAPGTHPSPSLGSQSPQPVPGQPVKLVVRVERLGDDQIMTATVMQPDATGTYSPTGQRVEARYGAAGPLVMGQSSDLRPGVLLQVDGTTSRTKSPTTIIDASRLVNLTGFVPSR